VKIVACFGTKGGTGKRTLSHLLAYGASLHGLAALVVQTDRPGRSGADPRRLADRQPLGPTLPKHPRRPKAEAYIAQLPRERVLCRLGESVAADRFTESDRAPWTTPSARVTTAARALYRRIADQLAAPV
jgi:hypothetical protein